MCADADIATPKKHLNPQNPKSPKPKALHPKPLKNGEFEVGALRVWQREHSRA